MERHRLAKLPMLLVFPVLTLVAMGCAGQGPRGLQASERVVYEPKVARLLPAEEDSRPAETLAKADQLDGSRLGASRGQFDEDRQIAVLQEEVLLYTQFLERAGSQPELEPAVRKSHERIADANATILFLRNQQRAEGREPAQTE